MDGFGVAPVLAAPVAALPWLVWACGAAHQTAAVIALIKRIFERLFIEDLRTNC